MTAFDNWAELDPFKLQCDIIDSACGDVTLTRYVDVEDMCRRINQAHPGMVDQWGMLDTHRLLQELKIGCSGNVNPENVLQLNGENLQLNGDDLVLGQ